MTKFLLRTFLAIFMCCCCTAAALTSAQLPLEARNAEGSSEEEEVISTSYVLPNQIFNNGKPYYASKDPVSGQLDFNIKKPAGIDSAVNEVIDPNEKAIITSSSPNIHDFLNLPVKYSSSKFVYPLVSSSYANLKYQGSNKNFITNKKPTQVVQVSMDPNYHAANYYTVPTTKLTPVASTSPVSTSVLSSTASKTSSTTTRKPTPASTSSSTYSTSTSTSTTTTTSTTAAISQTTKAPIAQTSLPVQSSSNSQKYTTSTRKPTQSTTAVAPKTSTTRKKFVPSKKFSTTPTPSQTTSTSLRFPDQEQLNTVAPPRPTTHPIDFSNTKTTQPIVFTEDPTASLPFSPLPSSTSIPNLDPADVYHSLDQKNTANKFEQKPSMTLADIFNSLVEEESAIAANNPVHQGLDAEGNLMEPLDPSKPSPFAMHNNELQRPPQSNFGNAAEPPNTQQQQQSPLSHQPVPTVSGSQDNFSNEYVSYQVQQPNILQYRPAPGAINNVVISPGQNSASLVLGSQQQVGQNAFGSVEKEPLFSKEHPVQYGTVINEDISGISRQPIPSAPSPYQEIPSKSPFSNFHQNGHFASNQEPKNPELQRPLPPGQNYQELPPAPPSPYQQLPLIGNVRNKPNNSKNQKPLSQSPTTQNQPLPSSSPIGSVHMVSPQDNSESSISLNSNQDTKELLVSTNIRFPVNEEQSAEGPSLLVAAGPPAGPQVNGHAQPLSLQQIQNSNPVVFPKQDDSKPQTSEIVFHNTPNTNTDGVQIQKQEVLTMSQHKQKLTFPATNEPNTPAQHMIPPPLPNSIGSEHDLQKPVRPHGNPQYVYNEYTRKPIPGITRPNPDRHLPNILPQFRPNAKISNGHSQQANFNQEPGNIRVTGPQQSKRGPINGNPQFSHRRQPLGGQPKRYPLTRMADYPAGLPSPNEMSNRRVYRVSPYGGASVQYLDRPGLHVRRLMPHNLRPAESTNVERHALVPALEKLPVFEEEDLVINDPPQPVAPTKNTSMFSEAKLEPVVTLQMLQSQKKALPSADSGDGEIQVPSIDSEESEGNVQDNSNGLYVVYPIKGNKLSENVQNAVDENDLPAVAHIEPPTGSEYQNTPFSIIRDRQQEPVLKNKKPLSLQQHNKAQKSKDSFPYPIEKPDSSYSELNSASRVSGVVIAPQITNVAYVSASEAPIAIAYTPTEPSRNKGNGNQLRLQQQQQATYSKINLATPVIKEIRTDTQTEEALNGHDFDLRAQNYEKNFMAPFYPSVSLDSVTITPTNHWNAVPTSTDKTLYEKYNIDRSDVDNGNNNADESRQSSTKSSFVLDKFQPELQGGFKPIYPPGYKLSNEQEEQKQVQEHEIKNMPLALASHMEPQQKVQQFSDELKTNSSPSSTPLTTIKPLKDEEQSNDNLREKPIEESTSTAKPTKRTKSKFETSLAALLFGEDDEDANEAGEAVEHTQARQEPTKAMMSGPRSLPRMGPRNMKI